MSPGAKQRIPRVIATVVVAHAALIWLALHGLSAPRLSGTSEHLILASVVAEVPAPMAPNRHSALLAPQALQRPPVQALPHAAALPTTRAPEAAAAVVTESAPSTTSPLASPAAASTRSATPAPATVVLPSSDADYLNNPPPVYPRMSRRMGEQGTVLVRVLINTEGRAEQAEIRTSSGYVRLDEAALDTVKRWRYMPGKRAGTAEAMWFNVPLRFVLD